MFKYLLLFFPCLLAAHLDVKVRAESAILINADTGAVIYEKNAHTPLYPASITKVATALYALELLKGDVAAKATATREATGSISEKERERSNFTVNPHTIEIGGSHMGIKVGEELSYEALLHGLLLVSANDAANVIGQGLGNGSIDHFVDGMNERLQKLGCKDTYFVCLHGHHHPDHVTTAYDMALIAKEAMEYPLFRKIVSSPNFVRPETNKQPAIALGQSNKLVCKGSAFYYDKATGIKTGSGSRAKKNLVASASKDGRNLIAVLMKAEQRGNNFEDAKKLFEAAFHQPKLSQTLVQEGKQKYSVQFPGASTPLKTYTKDGYTYQFYKGEKPDIHLWLRWETGLSLPIAENQKVGDVVVQGPGKEILKRVPLFAQNTVKSSLKSRIRAIFSLQGSLWDYIGIAAFVFLLIFARTLWLNRK